MRQINLTEGNITGNLLLFALPMMAGNILQQCYNIADTLIVGRYLGANALAAVGSSYTLMTFLTSILLGMCMGSGAVFSICFGQQNEKRLKESMLHSFCLIAGTALILNLLVYGALSAILRFLRVPTEVCADMRAYLQVIFAGITATFLYNYFAALLRAVGNSVVPLIFLGVSALTNIILDLFFILILNLGVEGAALATVIAQYLSGAGLMLYTLMSFPQWRIRRQELHFRRAAFREIAGISFLTCAQQSIMNFGILMVQGLVNSFGTVIMAAFAAAVKIDSFAYMPVQDFGNAFSTFIAQNYGAGESERIRKGVRSAVLTSFGFCIAVSALVFCFAPRLMGIFVRAEETKIIAAGVEYLRIEGVFYFGIGLLFLLYGYYRAVKMPGMSVILTVISLGTRVVLAYVLSAIPTVGVNGIWAAVPIGWALADVTGVVYYRKMQKKKQMHEKTDKTGRKDGDKTLTEQERYMKEAIRQAKKARALDEVPIGCVIVCDGKIIARGYNRRNTDKNTLSHAELNAIRKASKKLGDWRLEGCTMYVTLEPCQMCAGALVQSRIDHVVIGSMNPKAGCAGSVMNLLSVEGFNHQVEITRGILEEECSRMLSSFFQELREKKKQEKMLAKFRAQMQETENM